MAAVSYTHLVGEEFALLENRANGWSKIEYDGQEAFIKSEFLEAVNDAPADDEQGGDDQAADNAGEPENTDNGNDTNTDSNHAAPGAGDGAASVEVPSSGTYRLTTTVNIRKSASETADRLGVGYYGDEVEILMKQADGWTKVKFKGETGYIKTDILK